MEGPDEEHRCCRCLDGGRVRSGAPYGTPMFGVSLPCACQGPQAGQERPQWQAMAHGVPYQLSRATLANWEPATGRARLAAQNMTVSWPPEKPFLVLVGPPGTGKSHLAAAVLRGVYERHGHAGTYIEVPAFMDQMRQAQSDVIEDTPEGLQRWVEGLPLVVLDDLGKDKQTEWVSGRLYRIINARYGAGRPTIITLNPEEWGDLDPAVRSRLMDGATGVVCELTGPDRRPKRVAGMQHEDDE